MLILRSFPACYAQNVLFEDHASGTLFKVIRVSPCFFVYPSFPLSFSVLSQIRPLSRRLEIFLSVLQIFHLDLEVLRGR